MHPAQFPPRRRKKRALLPVPIPADFSLGEAAFPDKIYAASRFWAKIREGSFPPGCGRLFAAIAAKAPCCRRLPSFFRFQRGFDLSFPRHRTGSDTPRENFDFNTFFRPSLLDIFFLPCYDIENEQMFGFRKSSSARPAKRRDGGMPRCLVFCRAAPYPVLPPPPRCRQGPFFKGCVNGCI